MFMNDAEIVCDMDAQMHADRWQTLSLSQFASILVFGIALLLVITLRTEEPPLPRSYLFCSWRTKFIRYLSLLFSSGILHTKAF